MTILVCVSDDPVAERKQLSDKLGAYHGPDKFHGCAVEHKGKFGLFIDRKSLTNEVIAHEVYHLTQMIMKYLGAQIDNEPAAYLAGWLTQEVYGLCNKWRERISNKKLI